MDCRTFRIQSCFFSKSEIRIWHSMHLPFSTNSTLILMYEEYANRHEASFLKVCPGGIRGMGIPVPRCYVPVEGICLIWSTIQLSNYIRSRWQPTSRRFKKFEIWDSRACTDDLCLERFDVAMKYVSRFMILLVN